MEFLKRTKTNKEKQSVFFFFFGLLFLHFLHPCPKSDQSPNPACSPSLASPVPILSYSSPQHIHLGPCYFMMRFLQWDLFSASFSTTSFSSKGPLRPFKLIPLIHHFQGLILSHYIMESLSQEEPCRSLSQNSYPLLPSFSLQYSLLLIHPEMGNSLHRKWSIPLLPWLLEHPSQGDLTILSFPPIGWSPLFSLPTISSIALF